MTDLNAPITSAQQKQAPPPSNPMDGVTSASLRPGQVIPVAMSHQRLRKYYAEWAGKVAATYDVHREQLHIDVPGVLERWTLKASAATAIKIAYRFKVALNVTDPGSLRRFYCSSDVPVSLGDALGALRDCVGAIDSMATQIEQMRGLFSDEDQTIADALDAGEQASDTASKLLRRVL